MVDALLDVKSEEQTLKCVTRMVAGDGVDEIARIIPKCSAVAVVAQKDSSAPEYMRRLRRAGMAARLIVCGENIDDIAAASIVDDVRLIVSYGGNKEADFAKRLGKEKNIKVFAVICTPDAVTVLDRFCALYRGNALVLEEGAVPVCAAVASDLLTVKEGDLPSAFGNICAAALGLFDREAYLRAVGKSGSETVRNKAYDLIYRALDITSKHSRADSQLPIELAEISLKLSLLTQAEDFGFVRASADCCARTAEMLLKRESRALMLRGEYAFVFGSVLSKIYREFAGAPCPFAPPPDNNLRAELIGEYLGLEPLTAASAAVSRVKNSGLAAYRIHEYRDELSEIAACSAKIFEEGKKRFKRLYADDGYSMVGKLDSTDVKTVIALAPDMFPVCGNALMLMREFGLLDRFLI